MMSFAPISYGPVLRRRWARVAAVLLWCVPSLSYIVAAWFSPLIEAPVYLLTAAYPIAAAGFAWWYLFRRNPVRTWSSSNVRSVQPGR